MAGFTAISVRQLITLYKWGINMETVELEEEVRSALIGNADLMAVLPNGANGIYHYVAPSADPKRYPIIVYSPISDVPALAGDNCEIAHRVTIRIHVIAAQKRNEEDEQNFIAACRLVKNIMESLGFFRRQTIPYIEDGKIMRLLDFVRGV